MSITLTYEFDSEADFNHHTSRLRAYSVVWEFQQYIRNVWKYEETEPTLDEIFKQWRDILDEHDLAGEM